MFSTERSRSPSPERPRTNRSASLSAGQAGAQSRGTAQASLLAAKITALAQAQQDAQRRARGALAPVPEGAAASSEGRKRSRPLDLEQRQEREQRLKFDKALAKAPKPPTLEPPPKRRKTDNPNETVRGKDAPSRSPTMTVREIEAELAMLERRRRELLRLKSELLRTQPLPTSKSLAKNRAPIAASTASSIPAPQKQHTPARQQQEQRLKSVKRKMDERRADEDEDEDEDEEEEDWEREDSSGDGFIDRGYEGEGDEALYSHNYSDFIRALGFSRGPTSISTYRDLGGKMDRSEEAALRALEREWRETDKRGTGSFLDVTKEEARSHYAAKRTDAEEARREREERARAAARK